MVDDSREEHRMIIFGNDSDPVQEHLIREGSVAKDRSTQNGILERKIHAESYTVTLYALLKDYGLIPVFRIKPRIRFHRFNYDNQASSAPLRYNLDDIVDFAEVKRGIESGEPVDSALQEQVFGDAPSLKGLSDDPALQLVSQRDLFLRNPPFKTKTKVFGGEDDHTQGIPIGKFLDALNYPTQTQSIFKPFPQGSSFATDLLEALEPFHHLEFQFGVYSRYERRDCVLAGDISKAAGGYRTTFDPWTVLGYIHSNGQMQQLQILAHERGTRWEHKIMIEEMDPPTLELISQKIRTLRQDNLIGRVLSKSQTGLTLLADTQEARINATNDLFVDYELQIETALPKDRFADIECRRKLRGAFNSNGQYQLHPLNKDIVEKHLNLAKGVNNSVIYTLDNVYLMQGPIRQRIKEKDLYITRTPIRERVVMRSAQELRDRMPTNGFEECWNESIDEAGYTIINKASDRCYIVSYGRRKTGNILDGTVTRQPSEYYLSIKYLGITPERYGDFISKTSKGTVRKRSIPPRGLFNMIATREDRVIREMKNLMMYLKNKKLT
ncbi:hypothetical protein J4G02_11540 [Candidatus Poribacteria bacterium]|nr:hypothetical protein [Candidatus Poribacteria bacterium]